MAFCENCGRELPELAAACPACGHPIRTAPTLELADFWTRFGGALIDALILIVPGLLVAAREPVIGGIVVGFLYHWLLVAYWDGQTVGKRVVGVRILRPDGSPVDTGTAAARSGMRIVSGFALGLGFLWAVWDPEKRTWHDMLADTRAFRTG
jgi:uncharacterized RDD family membrane protein YckC